MVSRASCLVGGGSTKVLRGFGISIAWTGCSWARVTSAFGWGGDRFGCGAGGPSTFGFSIFLGGGGAGAGIAMAVFAIKFGAGRSWRISTFGTGSQINCSFDFAFGAVAMITCFDNSFPTGVGEVPIRLVAST